MTYTVKSSERLRHPAAEMETKALLHLMNFRSDSHEIYYFVVDFFNDLTGMDNQARRLWDLQSKGAKNSSPKAIGKELVTLFKNYRSDLDFGFYVLFLGGVSNTVRIDNSTNIFDISNIKPASLIKLKEGLIEECQEKTYIDSASITKQVIDSFLNKVQFVIDDKKPSDYVRSIVKINRSIIPNEETLTAIFNEIRNEQAGKKNIRPLEDITIEGCDEALDYYHHLTSGEIKLLVLSRILNRNPFDKGIPPSFIPIFNHFPEEKRKNALDDCQIALTRVLFNKNCADSFWELFENVYLTIVSNPTIDVNKIYRKLNQRAIDDCPDFDVISLKYFISIVKDGIDL
ncbi:hypothetical protein [Halobacillus litoralis]|uniref:CD-NTase associated protein 4-like DNA endonuclease domain-containing protein n=1 Tax=Halobacillus litoralis TaxID=45668 RepID=A0A410MC52_9BACI|nr:hypothetical protein [Halobacillus litoralis]QAS52324.1 hypothetical protein HLI_08830 [Halobacillus litoralis]